MKLFKARPAVEGTIAMGFPPDTIVPIGVIAAICLALYLIPRTALIGALLLTGYLGGAIATHVRHADPLFTHILAPIYFAAILESDQGKAALLIERAQGAIRDRIAELQAAPPPNARERQDLDSALMYLGILLDHMGQESGSLLWDRTA